MDSVEFIADRFPSWRKSLSAALLSKRAYSSERSIQAVCKNHWKLEICQVIEYENYLCFLVQSRGALAITFRGAVSAQEWLSASDSKPIETEIGTVSDWAYRLFQGIRDPLQNAIRDLLGFVDTVTLTGHGLGGSLALIAALDLEFPQDRQDVSLITFGQPRTCGEDLAESVDRRMAGRYRRYQFGSDLVTRYPTSLRHAGRLFRLDSTGLAKVDYLLVERPDSILQQLSEDYRQIDSSNEGLPDAGFADSMGMILPDLADHRIDNYVKALRRLAQEEESELPSDDVVPTVQATTESIDLEVLREITFGRDAGPNVGLESVGGGQGKEFPVLLRVSDGWEPYVDLRIDSQFGDLVTCLADQDQLERLRRDPMVQRIESSREGGIRECAVSIPFIRADQAHQPPLREKGEQCLVGVIDTGVDVLHHAFRRDADPSRVRIIGIWDQTNLSGPSPHSVDQRYSQRYGTYYNLQAIQDFVDGIVTVPPNLRDPDQHGTHVTSIAAGRAVGGFAGGVAPEAEIVVVIPDMDTLPGMPQSIGYSKSHVDALFFLKQAALNENKPIAVNVSLGMNAGPHDGSSLLEANFDAATGNGRDRGIVVVKSAGNERGRKGHANVQASTVGLREVTWDSSATFRHRDYIECWYGFEDDLEFTLADPQGNRSATVSRQNRSDSGTLGGNDYILQLDPNHIDNGDCSFTISIRNGANQIQAGRWRLEILGRSINSDEGRIDAWVERDSARAVEFDTGDNDQMTLSVPGTALHVITVGAIRPQPILVSSDTSSLGLTRDLRKKPEICAPGVDITAALANSIPDATIPDSGTSMAAPHVTGAMCLAMSKRRKDDPVNQLNARQLRSLLIQSCNNFTHNDAFGFGSLDVVSFLDRI